MLVSLEVGKVDAGVAVLLTEDKRLIEFPSILLPPDISSGSIVDVEVSRNVAAEARNTKAFTQLQAEILSAFGSQSPTAPVLRCRNATQTSVVLEWDPIELATADLRSLSLYRNGTKAGAIPRPFEMTSTKISGLAVDTAYTFSLVLRTSAGTYSSEKLTVRTHKMTDLSGITVTPGIMAQQLRDGLEVVVDKIGAKLIDQVRIDTTHFVCTEGRGAAWEKAKEMNIPIVTPDWVIGCEREGRLVSVRGYYLNANPRERQVGPSVVTTQSPQQQGAGPKDSQQEIRSPVTPRTEITPPTPEQRGSTKSGQGQRQESDNSDDDDEEEEGAGEEQEEDHAKEEKAQGRRSEMAARVANNVQNGDEDEEEDEEEDEDDEEEEAEERKSHAHSLQTDHRASAHSSSDASSTTAGKKTPSGSTTATAAGAADTFDDIDL